MVKIIERIIEVTIGKYNTKFSLLIIISPGKAKSFNFGER